MQTAQFCSIYIRGKGGETYSDPTKPLRELSKKGVLFKWGEKCQESFNSIKEALMGNQLMAAYDPKKATRVYVDRGPDGVAATLAQEDPSLQVGGERCFRPVNYTSRALTEKEKRYSKVEGESLGVVFGILSN